jgi:hypothetical protein
VRQPACIGQSDKKAHDTRYRRAESIFTPQVWMSGDT